jgi:hypothetical protein
VIIKSVIETKILDFYGFLSAVITIYSAGVHQKPLWEKPLIALSSSGARHRGAEFTFVFHTRCRKKDFHLIPRKIQVTLGDAFVPFPVDYNFTRTGQKALAEYSLKGVI